MLEVLGRQLDFCDVCGQVQHRKDLARTQVRFRMPTAQNYFTYSEYNSSLWSCDATDAGKISIGSSNANECRFKVPFAETAAGSYATLTETGGAQTWTGAGTFRSNTAVDVSGATNITISAYAGPHQYNTDPETTFAMGLCDSSGANKSAQRSWTIKGNMRIWFTMAVADIASPLSSSTAYFYIAATPATGKDWWIEDLQLAKDVTSPGTFIQTNGSTYDTTQTTRMTVRKVCEDCCEPLLNSSTGVAPGRVDVEQPISVQTQEP